VIKELQQFSHLSVSDRYDLWLYWTHNKDFSHDLKQSIELFNISKGLKASHSYGYKTYFFCFMEDISKAKAQTYFYIDKTYKVLYP